MTLGKFLDLSGPQLNRLGNRAHGIRCRYHRIISAVVTPLGEDNGMLTRGPPLDLPSAQFLLLTVICGGLLL